MSKIKIKVKIELEEEIEIQVQDLIHQSIDEYMDTVEDNIYDYVHLDLDWELA